MPAVYPPKKEDTKTQYSARSAQFFFLFFLHIKFGQTDFGQQIRSFGWRVAYRKFSGKIAL